MYFKLCIFKELIKNENTKTYRNVFTHLCIKYIDKYKQNQKVINQLKMSKKYNLVSKRSEQVKIPFMLFTSFAWLFI